MGNNEEWEAKVVSEFADEYVKHSYTGIMRQRVLDLLQVQLENRNIMGNQISSCYLFYRMGCQQGHMIKDEIKPSGLVHKAYHNQIVESFEKENKRLKALLLNTRAERDRFYDRADRLNTKFAEIKDFVSESGGWANFKVYARDAREDIKKLKKVFECIGGMAGHPDAKEGCRNIVKKVNEVLDDNDTMKILKEIKPLQARTLKRAKRLQSIAQEMIDGTTSGETDAPR